jgi:hypothetical protein
MKHPDRSGHKREKVISWRRSRGCGKLIETVIQVHIRPGMREKFREKVQAMKFDEHSFTKTVARSITSDAEAAQIELIWKNTDMPNEATRQQDLQIFQQALADVLDWETAIYSVKDIVLYT